MITIDSVFSIKISIRFEKRAKRPQVDPINALISFEMYLNL